MTNNLLARNINPLIQETPLGYVRFNCLFNAKSLATMKPQATVSLNQNATCSLWRVEECVIEFLCLKFSPKLPPGMHVDHCFAGVWKIKTLGHPIAFKLNCCLDSPIKPDACGHHDGV